MRTSLTYRITVAPQAEADPTHSKNINYEGVRTIIQAAQASGTCGRVVRITGKGETPWSVLDPNLSLP